jgi:hypothetical protein
MKFPKWPETGTFHSFRVAGYSETGDAFTAHQPVSNEVKTPKENSFKFQENSTIEL